LIEKRKETLDVRQLSEGERGVLSLVLDLAKRLSQLNNSAADPLASGEAVVLIDELDLHLHPKWQRTIVKRLTNTFPKCQFIATTHSPQIVAAVKPEQVLLLTCHGTVAASRTLGMDSNWILRHLMEDEARPAESAAAIRKVEAVIRKGSFTKARVAILAYRKRFDLPEWAILETRMARMEALAK
jgi:predicted ATP-binding protein involved in virulence